MTQEERITTLEKEITGNAAVLEAASSNSIVYPAEPNIWPTSTDPYKELNDKLDKIISLMPYPQI